MTDPDSPPIVYRAGAARTLRLAGRVCVAAAILVVAAVLLRLPSARWTGVLSDVLVIVAVGAALAAAGRALLLASGRGPRLELTAEGFRNRTRPPLPGGRAQRREGTWSDVRRLQAVREGGRRLLVLTVADGGRSVVFLRRLAAPPADVEADIRGHLDAAHGYRPYGTLGAPPKAPRPARPGEAGREA